MKKHPCRNIKIYILFILMLTAVILGGCGTTRDRSEPLRIALITPRIDTPYWPKVLSGALGRAEQLGNIEVTHLGATNENSPGKQTEKQIEIVEECIYEGYDGIILAAADRDALVVPIKEAKDAGIPVVMVDTGVSEPVYDILFATDNERAGKLCAELMAEQIGGEGEVAILNFSDKALVAMRREDGFVREITKNWPKIRVVGVEYCDYSWEAAAQYTEEFIQSYPGLKGVWAMNGAVVMGAVAGVAAQEKKDSVTVIGFDGIPELKELLKSGAVKASVVQNPGMMGAEGVQAIVDILDGKTLPSRNVDMDVTVVTEENVDDEDIHIVLGW